MPIDAAMRRQRSRARLVAVVVGLLVVGGAGYAGFWVFATGGLSGSGIMALAAATGFAAFFSPCSFPLLMTFLARRADESPGQAVAGALRVAFGAATLLAAAGAAMALVGDALGTAIAFERPTGRAFRVVVGLVLVVLGLD